MAQVNCHSPVQQHDPAIELAALRAKCARLQSERDKFKEALWALRGNFSALQTHAETLELENGDLKDVISMNGDFWDKHAISQPAAQEHPDPSSPSTAIVDTPPLPPIQSAVSNGATASEPGEEPASTLPKPIMRMQQFVEGSSNPAPGDPGPSSMALTVGSMGPPPSPRSSLQFQPGTQLVEPGSHNPNLPRCRTLVPVGSPSSYKKSAGNGQNTARPKSSNLGSSVRTSSATRKEALTSVPQNSRELRSSKRPSDETPSPTDDHSTKLTKKARISDAPHDIRSMISLPEDTDSNLRAHFDSLLTPSDFASAPEPDQSQAYPSTIGERARPGEGISPPGTNTTQSNRFTPEPEPLPSAQQAAPPPTHEQDLPEEPDDLMQVDVEVPHLVPAKLEVMEDVPPPPVEPESSTSGETDSTAKPSFQENSDQPELNPALDPPPLPKAPTPAEEAADDKTILVSPRIPARSTTRPPTTSSPAPSSASTRVTRSSRSVGDDLSSKPRRPKTSWDPVTGQRIQVGPPRGKPKPSATVIKESDTKRLVISIRPRNVRASSVRK